MKVTFNTQRHDLSQYASGLIYLLDLAFTVELIEEFGDGNLELGMVEVAIESAEGDQDEAAVVEVFVRNCEHLRIKHNLIIE